MSTLSLTRSLFALHGAVFAAVRLGTDAARAVARRVVRAALLAGVPCAVGAGTDDLATTVPVAAPLAAVLIGAWIALAQSGADRTRDGWALAASALAIAAVPVLGGPNLPDATLADGGGLTLAVAGPLVPLLIVAQAWVWWTFRGRVDRPSYL